MTTPARPDPIYIRDYPYNCTNRPSFPTSRIGTIIREDFEKNYDQYVKKADIIFTYAKWFKDIPYELPAESVLPRWKNGFIPPIDGAMLYSTVASRNPRYYVECGSGNSTKFVSKAIADHSLKTKIISIDPTPRAEVDRLCDQIFRIPFEEMDLSFFSDLTSDDIFLIDGSHRSFTNSDVTVFFTEILPELPASMVYAIHDVALPDEVYAERYYNEQYLLATYIIAGMMGDSLFFPTGFLSNHTTLLSQLEQRITTEYGVTIPMRNFAGFFWMQRAAKTE